MEHESLNANASRNLSTFGPATNKLSPYLPGLHEVQLITKVFEVDIWKHCYAYAYSLLEEMNNNGILHYAIFHVLAPHDSDFCHISIT